MIIPSQPKMTEQPNSGSLSPKVSDSQKAAKLLFSLSSYINPSVKTTII
jgi:hypothetical protein